jgi:hypothetical protein
MAQLVRAQVSYVKYDRVHSGNPEVASSNLAQGSFLVLFGHKFQPYRRLDVMILDHGYRLFCFDDTDKRLLRHPPPAVFWQHTHSSTHFRIKG